MEEGDRQQGWKEGWRPLRVGTEQHSPLSRRAADKKRKAAGQLVRYSDEVVSSWRAFTLVSGTVFTSRRLWSAVLFYWSLALAICLLILHFESEASRLQYSSFKALVDYLSTLIGFLLGMYVSNSLSRWWALRMHIMHLWGCVDDLCMLACSHVLETDEDVNPTTGISEPSSDPLPADAEDQLGQRTSCEEDRVCCRSASTSGKGSGNLKSNQVSQGDSSAATGTCQEPLVESVQPLRQGVSACRAAAAVRPTWETSRTASQLYRPPAEPHNGAKPPYSPCKDSVLHLILRLGMVVVHLTFDAAQRENGNLRYLHTAGLLTAEELSLLQPAPSKAQIVWVWLSQLSVILAKRGRLLFAANATRKWHEICARGRGEVAACWAYVETQLPFSYVHLLSILVHINNLFLSVLTGVGAAACVSQLAEAYQGRPSWLASRDPLVPLSPALSSASLGSSSLSSRSQQRSQGEAGLRPLQRRAVWEVTQMLLMHVMFLLVIPIFYHGMINLAQTIGNPFGYKSVAFPKDLYVQLMEAECSSFFTVGQSGPLAPHRRPAASPVDAGSPLSATGFASPKAPSCVKSLHVYRGMEANGAEADLEGA